MTELIITSSVLILVVILLRHFLKVKISLRLQYALWALVLIRLLAPVNLFESSWSILNFAKQLKDQPTMQTISAISNYNIRTQSFSSAYDEVVQQYEAKGVDVSKLQGGDLEALDYEAYALMKGPSVGELVMRVLSYLWYAGIGIVGLTLLLCNLSFGRKLRKTRKAYQADDCKLPVYEVEALPSPFLFGLFRPSIYITPEIVGDETKLCHVLAHELTHYRHGDHIWSALRAVCLAVHWYNPLVWLAAALSRRDSELACDEGTIKRIGEESRMEYGRTLIGLTCEKRKAMDLLCCATTMTDGKNGIKERIALIAKKPKLLIPAVIAVVLVALIAVGCTFTGAKTENAEIVPLTSDEVAQYNKAFEQVLFDEAGNPSLNPLCHFFTSYYDRPEDLNLSEFLRYFSSEDVTDESEFSALKAAEHWPFGADMTLDGMCVPIHRIPVKAVNSALEKHMGITVNDLSGVGMKGLVYLREYDAYYNFTSDAGAGFFVCVSGERQGDILRLHGETGVLTLKKKGDVELFVSFQQGEEPTAPNNAGIPVTIETDTTIPQAVVEFAKEFVSRQIESYHAAWPEIAPGCSVTDAKITGITQINTGTAGIDNSINMYRLEYRLLLDGIAESVLVGGISIEEIDGENWLTEWSSVGQPYLLLYHSADTNEWRRVCVTNTDVITVDYGTPEMLKRYGDAFTAAAMELYQKNLDIDQLPESGVLLGSLPDYQIYLYGDQTDYDSTGGYDGLYLSINGVIRYYEWQSIGKESFLPTLSLNDMDSDGQKELIVVLTTGEGTGVNQEVIHVINPENFVETGVTDPLEIISKNVDTSIVHENGSVAFTIIVNGQKSVITLPENYAQGWAEEKASFGSIVTYEVDGSVLKATVPAQISYTVFAGEIVITYAFGESQHVMKTIEYLPYEL